MTIDEARALRRWAEHRPAPTAPQLRAWQEREAETVEAPAATAPTSTSTRAGATRLAGMAATRCETATISGIRVAR